MKKQILTLILITICMLALDIVVCAGARVTNDQVALYTFKEGSGTTVNDVSGVGAPLNLTVASEAAISWIPGGGLSVDSSTLIESGVAATKVIDAVKASNEITIEAWIKPANNTQEGPARIFTLSSNTSYRNFTLGQQTNTYDVRFRTTSTSLNGIPSVTTPAGTLTTDLTHLVYTRATSGEIKIYIDGNEISNGNVGGDSSNWDNSYHMALANELTNDRTWLGEFYLVAIFDRTLTEPEIDQNFATGHIVECTADGDCDDSNLCTDDTCVDYECQNTNNTSACDDGLFCNGNDTCSGGSCSVHAGNPCPVTECNTCQEDIDSCFDPAGTACTDDGNVCTNDQCDGAGACVHPNNNDPCDDGLFCNGTDICGGGICSFHSGNPCPETECNTCQEDIDSCFDPLGAACTDDGNVCSDDQCNGAGVCAHPNNNDPCDDGLFCNGNDTCSGGSCSIHAGNPCPETECNTCQEDIDSCFDPLGAACTDDGNQCTDDECNGAGACAHPNNNDPCDDGLFCNGNDTCNGGNCSSHSGDPCADDVAYCTGIEYCDESIDSCESTGDPCNPLLCDEVDDNCTDSTVSLIVLDAYGTPGTINIALDNLEDEVSEVSFDLCDPEKHAWLNIPTGACTLTGRVPQGAGSSCQITDPVPADGCLSLEIVAETGDFIQLGSGPIAKLSYTLAPAPAVGEFADLIPVNTDVRDDSDDILNVTPLPGKVGSECQGDGDCNDYNECTDDTCNGGLCEYANIAGPCDDGLFCNGNDTCSGGSCSVHSGDLCPAETTCNEATNTCDAPPINPSSTSTTTTTTIAECESDVDCDDDELFCNGDEICIKGECQHEGSPCTDDELFCNGEESCDEENDECISSGDPCSGGTTCFEETDECRSMGTCVISIEPETAAVVSEQSLNFTVNKTGDCDDPDYEWSVQSEAGSAVDQNGKYVAGINTDCSQELTDTIKLVDHANDSSVEATATVSCDRIIGVINISNPLWILFPSEIYSSHWLPLPHVLFVFAEQGNFDQTSSLSFEPIGSITTLLNVGIDDIMIALVLVGPNAQEGFYRATVLTDSDMVTKKEALIMNMMPWILDEE